jgi:NAD(P)-dependent dehydrogenase (short-subunit alcohol dehydrogenase family)
MDIEQLSGKGAIITGGAGGIGLGIARTLARRGVNIALADIEEGALARARSEIQSLGVRVITRRVDVASASAVRGAAADFEHFLGKVHLVFNNAGVEISGRALADVGDAEWQWIMGVNVFGVIHGIRYFVPLISKHDEGGHVVNTASIGGFQVNREYRLGPYSASKAAVVALSEGLAHDMEGSGIDVSVLCPASVNTRISESARNRGTHYGGPVKDESNVGRDRLRAALATGMTPDEVGAHVLRALRDREFYIFTHGKTKPWLEQRFARILKAFEGAEDR